MIPEGIEEREIGSIESSFLLIHDHFGGSYTGAVAAEIAGRIDRDVARRAMRALLLRHPLLRARLVFPEDGTTPRFVTDPELDLDSVFELGDWADVEWKTPLEEAIVPFSDRSAPLWRCRFLSNGAGDSHLLIVGAHHTAADALSLTYLVKGFLVNCAKLLRGAVPEERALELLPPIESLADAARDLKRDWGDVLRIARAHVLPSRFRHAEGSPSRALRSGVESVLLAPERTSAILAACKAHKTPLSGLLTASLLAAVHDVFGVDSDLMVVCPMSCRALSRKVRLDDTRFGSYTRVAFLHAPKENLWPSALQLSQRLDVLSKAANFTKTVRFRGASRVFRAAARIPRRTFTHLAVSNLGIVDFSKSAFSPLAVNWLRFGANLNGGFEMFLLATCVVQKKLSLNLSFPEPHMPREMARATLEALERVLTEDGSRTS